VVLTGQGADEPFAGYSRHLGANYGRWFRMAPELLRDSVISPLINRLPRIERYKRAVRTLDIADPVTRLTQIYHIFESELKQRLYRPEFLAEVDTNFEPIIREWWKDVEHLDELNQMTYVDARFSLADNLLLYGDKMAMAASLEARVPFLDLDLMSLVEGMPAKYKIRGLTQKYLLKKAVTKWLPPEIVYRKKIGFATPVDQWFGGELRGYLSDMLLRHGSGCSLFFDLKELEKMINDHNNKRRDYQRHLFSLITFELWYQTFIVKSISTTDFKL
jgi:asparagine synthase (glutamine-hydrolysing)